MSPAGYWESVESGRTSAFRSSVGTTSTENEHVATDLIPTTPGSVMSTVTIESRAMSGGVGRVRQPTTSWSSGMPGSELSRERAFVLLGDDEQRPVHRGSSQSSRSRMVSKEMRVCWVEPGLWESRFESWVKWRRGGRSRGGAVGGLLRVVG